MAAVIAVVPSVIRSKIGLVAVLAAAVADMGTGTDADTLVLPTAKLTEPMLAAPATKAGSVVTVPIFQVPD